MVSSYVSSSNQSYTMFKGQLLFGNYGLTNRLTCSDSKNISLILDIGLSVALQRPILE